MIFKTHVQSLVRTMAEMGNPFKDTGKDLLVLDTRMIVHESVVESFQEIENLGREQAHTFFSKRIKYCTIPISEKVLKNKLCLFNHQPQKNRPHTQKELTSVRKDRNLFSSLYISCQVRDTDLVEFFKHENQNYPPSLSVFGNMRFGTKSDLLPCLEDLIPQQDRDSCQQEVDIVILDGAAIVNMIKPGTCGTFEDYVSLIMKYIRHQFKGSVRRVDMVFDIYKPDSLKSSLREKRGCGTRIRVEAKKKLPANWPKFLRDSQNKTELFYLIAERVDKELFPGVVIITQDELVRCSEPTDTEDLTPCSHEEADTRMLLHAAHGAKQGYGKMFIKTVDTDVVVLCVTFLGKLGCKSLLVAFGTGKSFRYINVTSVAEALGEDKCQALSSFHALLM